MNQKTYPENYRSITGRHRKLADALDELGRAIREEGPVMGKEVHLIQLAAATAIRSEGAVHSHVRRALEAGATAEEIRHTVILLTSTIGFPTVAAALSWVEDILGEEQSPTG